MFSSTLLTLSLTLGAAIAAPATNPPPQSQEFAILANLTGAAPGATTKYNFLAVQNSTAKSVVLVAQPCSQSQGCYATNPYFFNGNATDAALNVDLSFDPDLKVKGVYGIMVPKVGDAYGVVEDVTGVLNKQEFLWSYDAAGNIYHHVQAPLDRFYLCPDRVNGSSVVVLKWGQMKLKGGLPANCLGAVTLRKA